MPALVEARKRMLRLKKRYEGDARQLQNAKTLAHIDLGFDPERKQSSVMALNFIPMLVAVPWQMLFFFSIRNMAERHPEWMTGGMLWFPDLALPDPLHILPVCCGILTGSIFFAIARGLPPNPRGLPDQTAKSMFHGLGIGLGISSTVFAHYFGAGFDVYMCSGLLAGHLHRIVLSNDPVRARLGLQPYGWFTKKMKEGQEGPSGVWSGAEGKEELSASQQPSAEDEKADEEWLVAVIDRLLAADDPPLPDGDRRALKRVRRSAPFLSTTEMEGVRRMAQERDGVRQKKAAERSKPLIYLQIAALWALLVAWYRAVVLQREQEAAAAERQLVVDAALAQQHARGEQAATQAGSPDALAGADAVMEATPSNGAAPQRPQMASISDLPWPVQKMLRDLTTPPTGEDLELLGRAGTMDKAKLTVDVCAAMAARPTPTADAVWAKLRPAFARRIARAGKPAEPDAGNCHVPRFTLWSVKDGTLGIGSAITVAEDFVSNDTEAVPLSLGLNGVVEEVLTQSGTTDAQAVLVRFFPFEKRAWVARVNFPNIRPSDYS